MIKQLEAPTFSVGPSPEFLEVEKSFEYIFTTAEIKMLCNSGTPEWNKRAQQLVEARRTGGFISRKRNTDMMDSYRASTEVTSKALDALKLMLEEIDHKELQDAIGFYGRETILRIMREERMSRKSGKAILDYYKTVFLEK